LKVNEYLDAVRDVERRIQLVETQVDRKLPKLVRPAGVPETFTEHARMMFDLQVLAYQTDLTRVITFMVGREFGGRTYQEIGIPEGYHALTHHQYNPEKIAKVIQIQGRVLNLRRSGAAEEAAARIRARAGVAAALAAALGQVRGPDRRARDLHVQPHRRPGAGSS